VPPQRIGDMADESTAARLRDAAAANRTRADSRDAAAAP
jgi:hypothetical protein